MPAGNIYYATNSISRKRIVFTVKGRGPNTSFLQAVFFFLRRILVKRSATIHVTFLPFLHFWKVQGVISFLKTSVKGAQSSHLNIRCIQ